MPVGAHAAGARGFARSADAYERARPEYPPAAIAWLGERIGLGPGRRVVDLGAGTGKLTRPLAEVHRVLRPGGALALVWNRRPLDDPLHAAVEAIVAPHHRDSPAHRRDAWRAAFEATELFGPLDERGFSHAQELDADGLADRVGSMSFIASLPDGPRGEVLAAVRALAGDGTVTLPYVCEVFACDRCP